MIHSCGELSGRDGASESIDEAVARGVFARELRVVPDVICIETGRCVKVQECWLERTWVFGEPPTYQAREGGGYQVVMSFDDTAMLERYGGQWVIGPTARAPFEWSAPGTLRFVLPDSLRGSLITNI